MIPMIGRAGRLVLLVAVLGTIGCDRLTKHVATATLAGMPALSFLADTVRLDYAENTGGFLSVGASLPSAARTIIFTVATGVTLVWLTVLGFRRGLRGWPALGLALFVAGGASNWIDRVVDGRVVDFLNVGIGSLRTGVFNVADMAIMLGAVLFLLGEFAGAAEPASLSRPPGPAVSADPNDGGRSDTDPGL